MAQDTGYSGLLTGQIARVMFAIPFAAFAAFHFRHAEKMQSVVPDWIVGSPTLWVYATGAVLALGAFCFLTGAFTYQAGLAVGTMLLVFAFLLHFPKAMSAGLTEPSDSMLNFLKDFALAGAAYYIGGRASY